MEKRVFINLVCNSSVVIRWNDKVVDMVYERGEYFARNKTTYNDKGD